MTDYRDRVLKGMLVPAVIFRENPACTVTSSSIREHQAAAGINSLERVHGANSRDNDFVMMVDDEGRDMALKYNPRAQYLSGYPLEGGPIVGDVLFFSEGYGDDGMDIQDLTDTAERWLTSTDRQDDYERWCLKNAPTIALYTMRYPGRI